MAFIKANDIKMYYEQYGAGEELVLISGLSADHTAWELQLEQLSQHFHVTVFDNRGTGQTNTPEGPYTIKLMADDTIALMRSLNIEHAHIVGHSMGGQIAQEMAVSYPDSIKKLILVCSTASVPATANMILAFNLKLIQAKIPDELIIEYNMPFLFARKYLDNRDNISSYIDKMLSKQHPQTMEGYAYQLHACVTHHTHDRLNQIVAPTLVIGSEEDILFPIQNARYLADNIANATLMTFKDIAHMPNFECPQKYGETILNFLA